MLSLHINGLFHGGVLVLKRGLFVLRAFSPRYHCGKSILRRREVSKEFREEAEHNDEQLTPYSFSHRYAKQAHAARLVGDEISKAMGYTIEVHLKSYARFKPDKTAANCAAVNT